MPVSPLRIVMLLILLNTFLGLIVLLFPSGERGFVVNANPPFLHLADSSVSDDSLSFKFQFVSAHELFNPKETVVVDLDSVLGDIDLDTIIENEVIVDTSYSAPELNKRIQFASQDKTSLSNFFRSLKEVENGSNEVIRILHYGDSQLEGDRISDYLRNKVQNRFGGNGPGIVLPIDVSRSRVSIHQSESNDWEKFAMYGRKRQKQGLYGIGGSSYAYTGQFLVKVGEDTIVTKVYDSLITKSKIVPKKSAKTTDTLTLNDTVDQKTTIIKIPFDSSKFTLDTQYKPIYEKKTSSYSWLKFRCASRSYPRVRTFSHVQLMYQSKDSVYLTTQIDQKESVLEFPPAPYGTVVTLHKGLVTNEVLLKFTGVSPLVFGVVMDGERGVAVDNFPMRGSSGTGYSTIKQSIYKRQLALSNTKLVVMQYGINVVPNPQKSYNFYQRMFDAELKAIKAAMPDVNILVIGPSDMSRKVAGEYVSYPNITKIRDAMKNAAFENGCAFWDLYSVMGGENSMVGWVNNTPALASKDYTHFNARGARYIGEILYDALMTEYVEWKQSEIDSKKPLIK